MIPSQLIRTAHFLRRVQSEFRDDRCPQIAAALSFTSVLSIVPLLTVVFTTLALVPKFRPWRIEIEKFVFANFVPASGDVLEKYFTEFVAKAASLQTFGFVLLAVSVIAMMATIERTLNEIWHVTRHRSWLRRGLLYVAVLALVPCTLTLGLVVTSYLASLPLLRTTFHIHFIVSPLVRLLPFMTSMLAFATSYKFIPNRPVRWLHAFIGGLVAALIFEAAKHLFALYILRFPAQQAVYGAFAVIPIFLLWIYLSWLIVLFGAELTFGFAEFWPDKLLKKSRSE